MAESDTEITQLLEVMVNLGASDLHITVGSPPMYRIDGDLKPVDASPLMPRQTEEMMRALTPPAKRQMFEEQGAADFSYAIHGVGRYRVNIYHQRGSTCLAIRLVNNKIQTLEELGLPDVVGKVVDHKRGLIIVTGGTGSGKSTTLAAMIRRINDSRRAHIITLEDPIEFLHTHHRSLVNQIELGVDTLNGESPLKQALRHDPDVILYGELRDAESVRTVLGAAETGHLVLTSLTTANPHKTLNRMLSLFDPEGERLILQELGMHLLAIISQRLVRKRTGKGRIAAYEILLNTPQVSEHLTDGRLDEIGALINAGEEGMISLEACLARYVREEKVSREEALQYVENLEGI